MSGHFRAEWLHGAGFQRFHNPPLLKTGSGGPPRDVAYCHVNNSHGSFMRQLPVLRHGIGWLAAQTDASWTLRHSRVVARSPLLSSFFSFSSFLWYPQAHPPPRIFPTTPLHMRHVRSPATISSTIARPPPSPPAGKNMTRTGAARLVPLVRAADRDASRIEIMRSVC